MVLELDYGETYLVTNLDGTKVISVDNIDQIDVVDITTGLIGSNNKVKLMNLSQVYKVTNFVNLDSEKYVGKRNLMLTIE